MVFCREWVECCAEAAGLPADCQFYDYRRDWRMVRDFFPFYDYDTRIHEICPHETDFIEGLRNSCHWYLENREAIAFKEQVARNEEQIRQKLGLK